MTPQPRRRHGWGAFFTGKQALDLKLIDEMGDQDTAIAWLIAASHSQGPPGGRLGQAFREFELPVRQKPPPLAGRSIRPGSLAISFAATRDQAWRA